MSYTLFDVNKTGGMAGGGTGQNTTGAVVADPDIAAQGAQQQKLQQMNIDWQKQKFGAGMSLLGKQLAGMQQQNGLVGGASGAGPHIPGGPLWTQQAINQKVNANAAHVDQETATNQKDLAGQMAGKGFGARSPLAMALAQQGQQSAMGQKADYNRQFLPQARQQNAQFDLGVGQAQEQQFAQRNQEDIQRRQALYGQQNSLISALGGLFN